MTTIINNIKLTVYNTSALPSTFVKSVLSISPFKRRTNESSETAAYPESHVTKFFGVFYT